MATLIKRDNDYTVQVYLRPNNIYIPKDDIEERIVKRLARYKIKDHQIHMIFENLSLPDIMLMMNEVHLKLKNGDINSPFMFLVNYLKTNHSINIMEDIKVNTMKYVHNFQVFARWLRMNNIEWTYINVYTRRDRTNRLGRIYYDEPIPQRLD